MTNQTITTLNDLFNGKFYATRKAFRTSARRFADTQKLYYVIESARYIFWVNDVEYSIGYDEDSHLSDVNMIQHAKEQLAGHCLMTKGELIDEINKIAAEYLGYASTSILGLNSRNRDELIATLERYTKMIVYRRRYIELFALNEVPLKDSWKLGCRPDEEQPNWYREAMINFQRAAELWVRG